MPGWGHQESRQVSRKQGKLGGKCFLVAHKSMYNNKRKIHKVQWLSSLSLIHNLTPRTKVSFSLQPPIIFFSTIHQSFLLPLSTYHFLLQHFLLPIIFFSTIHLSFSTTDLHLPFLLHYPPIIFHHRPPSSSLASSSLASSSSLVSPPPPIPPP